MPQYHIFYWIGGALAFVAAIVVMAIAVEMRKQKSKK